MTLKNLALSTASVSLLVTAPMAGELVYTPINPSFGGNALNSAHLLSIATAQRTATARDADDGRGIADDAGLSNAELFVRQLEGRLLSGLAGQVSEAIFGDDPVDSGLVGFGTTTVAFERTGDNPTGDLSAYPNSIVLTVTDNVTGEVTVIAVPQLVTDNT